jgi:hypothetical protein
MKTEVQFIGHTKKVVCFANSRKYGFYCVAGKELDGTVIKGWIRPVSNAKEGGELSGGDIIYSDTTKPKPLDIISIPFCRPLPTAYQTENHLVDRSAMWIKITTLQKSYICMFLDSPETLWLNGYNTVKGCNDRLPIDKACGFIYSLRLIEPSNVSFSVSYEEMRKRVRAHFNYRNIPYKLIVTDPEFENRFKLEGEYFCNSKLYFCVSLSVPFVDNFCYKLIAGIVEIR